jgi:hypothetical protein
VTIGNDVTSGFYEVKPNIETSNKMLVVCCGSLD